MTLRPVPIVGLSAAITLLLCGCSLAPPRVDEPLQLRSRTVSTEQLRAGWEAYTLYCRACHGDEGDGRGPSAPGLRPPPRDFRQATFKFGWVVDGLPHDEDLARIVTGGLHGTAMLEWDIPQDALPVILQYLKTFAREDWADPDALGEQVTASNDPWGAARATEAVERGKKIYHGLATCWSCHPAYATKEEIHAASSEVGNKPITDFRANLYHGELKESEYRVEGKKLKIMPPDFTFIPLRASRSVADLYRTIGAGIPGTAMPAWKGALPEEDLWALAYYVDSLARMMDLPAAAELRRRMAQQPEFVPPAPPSAETPTGA